MRILYTAPFLSYPPIDGSRITPYNHLRCLAARGHELTMVYGLRRPEDRDNAAQLAPFGDVRTVPVGSPTPLGILFSAVLANESFRVRRHRLGELETEFERLLRERDFDLVYLDSLFTAYLVPGIRAARPELPIAVLEHNVESQVFRRLVRRSGGPWKVLAPWESPHILEAERRAVAAVDQVMALSQEDADALEALAPGSGVVCLGPGTDTFAGESIAPPPDRETALFLGTYQWPPNRDAASWLVREVWPHVRAAAPNARLVLAGKDPSGDVTGLQDAASGVEAPGFVESARDAYRAATVSLAPLRIGGGIRLKILDALANERPCVTTTLGVEGLGLRDGEEVSIRDDAQAFAAEVVRLLSRPDDAAELARRGRKVVEGRFSWDAVVDRLDGIFTRMVGAGRPTKERSPACRGRPILLDSPELIGRAGPLARLDGVFDAARGARGRVVLLAGEAGVGKTRLAEEALAQSSLDVLIGRARQDATPPYGPIASVLRDCFRQWPEKTEDHGPLASHLSMLLPERGPVPADASPETLVEAVLGALAAAARRRALAVFLDDLQWADNATLELLPLLAERIAGEPAVVVATYLSDEIGRGHPVRRLRNDLRRARLVDEISIDPLDRADADALLARAVGATPDEALRDLVFEKTQGVPLYIGELADALASSGRLHEGAGVVSLAAGETVPIPESIRDAVMLRLDSLSEAARDTVHVAAVAGMEFDLELVSGLAGGEAGLEELLSTRVVFEAGAGAGAFRHALIREAIRGEIAWSKRRSLHRSIAAYLDRAGAPPEQVAEHWLAAGEHGPARAALLEVAERSCRLHAYRDAARAGHRALEIWPEGEDEEKRLTALEQLAHCAQVTGHLGDAVRARREVADSPLVARDQERRARAMRALATLYGLQGASEHESESRVAAAEAYEAAGRPAEAAMEWLAVAGRHTAHSALDRALETIRRAGDLARQAKRPEVVARARGFEGNVLAMQGQAEAGRALAQEALSIALESGATDATSEAFRRLASVLDYSSDFGGARDAYATAVDYCRTRGDDVNARVCLGCLSAIVYRTGEWKRALEVCREVMEDAGSPPGASSIAHGISGLIRAYRGETRPARNFLEEALARARQGAVVIMELMSRFGLALVAELEGDDLRAAALHEEVLEGWRETEDRHDLVPVFLWQSTFFARQGQDREATRRADALSSMASATGNPEALAALAHALGELAGLAGQPDEAAKHLRQALEQTEKLEIPLEHALTAWRLGVVLARAGEKDAAARHLASAYRLARNLGARPLAALIAADLEAQGERVEEGGHPDEEALAGRCGLTRRQAEIARLLADGLTNKEIAQKLFLSPRTIDMHVGHILERLDCRSRTEAARKAAELGLLD